MNEKNDEFYDMINWDKVPKEVTQVRFELITELQSFPKIIHCAGIMIIERKKEEI